MTYIPKIDLGNHALEFVTAIRSIHSLADILNEFSKHTEFFRRADRVNLKVTLTHTPPLRRELTASSQIFEASRKASRIRLI
jgi:hypothetical protein